jgi:PAS domain S-box-containing protein
MDRTGLANELHASRQRLRAVMDAALDCVIGMDHEGRIVDFNAAAERTFGLRAADVIGREMADVIVPPRLRGVHRAGLARYLAGGESRVLDRRIEINGWRADGGEFPVELTITRIAVPGPPLFVGYVRDITDRKTAERELRESRARIVTAADEARRRIERDLHDGAQQRLVDLGLTLRTARERLPDDPSAAAVRAALDEAIEDVARATAELRELARGIHPAVLTEGGLEPALAALAGRSELRPRLIGPPAERLPDAVEATAYYVVAEALTNVARHAEATDVEVEVTRAGPTLRIEVRDDGRGTADRHAGSGLRGLADRVAALDGTFLVISSPGNGTVVRAELPLAIGPHEL